MLDDASKLIPPEHRTFEGKVANDNFCFIADETSCCYQTFCVGDAKTKWVAGFNAAQTC